MRQLLRRVWYLLRRHQIDADLAEELAFHREMKTRELEAGGASSADAALAARRTMGSTALAHDRAHDVWMPGWLQGAGREASMPDLNLGQEPAGTSFDVSVWVRSCIPLRRSSPGWLSLVCWQPPGECNPAGGSL